MPEPTPPPNPATTNTGETTEVTVAATPAPGPSGERFNSGEPEEKGPYIDPTTGFPVIDGKVNGKQVKPWFNSSRPSTFGEATMGDIIAWRSQNTGPDVSQQDDVIEQLMALAGGEQPTKDGPVNPNGSPWWTDVQLPGESPGSYTNRRLMASQRSIHQKLDKLLARK